MWLVAPVSYRRRGAVDLDGAVVTVLRGRNAATIVAVSGGTRGGVPAAAPDPAAPASTATNVTPARRTSFVRPAVVITKTPLGFDNTRDMGRTGGIQQPVTSGQRQADEPDRQRAACLGNDLAGAADERGSAAAGRRRRP